MKKMSDKEYIISQLSKRVDKYIYIIKKGGTKRKSHVRAHLVNEGGTHLVDITKRVVSMLNLPLHEEEGMVVSGTITDARYFLEEKLSKFLETQVYVVRL